MRLLKLGVQDDTFGDWMNRGPIQVARQGRVCQGHTALELRVEDAPIS